LDPAVIINLTRKREEGIGEEGIRGVRIGEGERLEREGVKRLFVVLA
jgi:hypothetical protein